MIGCLLGVAPLPLATKQTPSFDFRRLSRPTSLASRFTAGAFGFLIFIQCGERPDCWNVR